MLKLYKKLKILWNMIYYDIVVYICLNFKYVIILICFVLFLCKYFRVLYIII